MKILNRALFFILWSIASLASHAALAETQPVPAVDLDRYLGDWYEIASIPQPYTKGCFCTRARYSLKTDGDILVDNTCHKNSVDGKLSEAKGSAYVVDKVTNAKLSVTFFWPFYGDYWIIGLDPYYRYALVSNRDGSDLWILSRTPKLDPEFYQRALQIADDNGIDITQLHVTEQQGCSYP